ncbi:hypothetical protein RHGRI_001497 [Rhododendron griersonianum]|uniref:Sec20 C-terminal domain-containing protein n=1 Tax=Rhododendron griersonianum TaxID=479676 RepID=A0AAV6LL95_9ERIC|nr:hypothetical protein RHGRI_001497 [Rhododendron griersonianum]
MTRILGDTTATGFNSHPSVQSPSGTDSSDPSFQLKQDKDDGEIEVTNVVVSGKGKKVFDMKALKTTEPKESSKSKKRDSLSANLNESVSALAESSKRKVDILEEKHNAKSTSVMEVSNARNDVVVDSNNMVKHNLSQGGVNQMESSDDNDKELESDSDNGTIITLVTLALHIRCEMEDKVVEAVDKAKKEWDEAYKRTKHTIDSIQRYGVKISTGADQVNNSLPRLNGIAQDGLALLSSLQFNLDLLAPQLPTDDDVLAAQSLRSSLRSANLQAKANMRKAAQEERELLLGGGEESTIRRRNLQTKAGMTSAAESITESLRRTRQLMVQEVERSSSTLMAFEESTGVLRKAEGEYKGHRSLLSRTRNLLSTMQRQDVLDRVNLLSDFCYSPVLFFTLFQSVWGYSSCRGQLLLP